MIHPIFSLKMMKTIHPDHIDGLQEKNINSKLGSIAKLSEKKIFPKKIGDTKVKQPVIDVSENTVVSGLTDVKYEKTPTKQDESDIEPETDMMAKKRVINYLTQIGYS